MLYRHIKDDEYVLTIPVDIERLKMVMHDYYSMEMPDEFWLEVLMEDPSSLREVLDGAETDTYAREGFIGATCKKLGIPDWPCYGDGPNAMKKFIPLFVAAVDKAGGKVLDGEDA